MFSLHFRFGIKIGNLRGSLFILYFRTKKRIWSIFFQGDLNEILLIAIKIRCLLQEIVHKLVSKYIFSRSVSRYFLVRNISDRNCKLKFHFWILISGSRARRENLIFENLLAEFFRCGRKNLSHLELLIFTDVFAFTWCISNFLLIWTEFPCTKIRNWTSQAWNWASY